MNQRDFFFSLGVGFNSNDLMNINHLFTRFWAWSSHLSHHAVPHVVDLLAMLPVGHQVQVVGELDVPGDLLEDVDAEALAALLDVGSSSFGGIAVEVEETNQRYACRERTLFFYLTEFTSQSVV